MSSTGAGELPPEIKGSINSEQDHCILFSLPLELREKIYSEIFATVQARDRLGPSPTKCLAILQTCARINNEASSVLHDRTDLRIIIGHRSVVSSIPPPVPIASRFQNISFKLIKFSDTFPSYAFEAVWNDVAPRVVFPSIPRQRCTIHCQLEEYAGHSSSGLFSQVKFFTAFETLSITYEGKVLENEFPRSQPTTEYSPGVKNNWARIRQREQEALVDVEKMLHSLEKYLGTGSLVDDSKDSKDWKEQFVWTILFHPLRNAKQTQP